MNNLELGAGKRPHKGYTTVDVEPSNHPDIVGDFRTMVFKDLDTIRAHHLLEHFSRAEAVTVLGLWRDWLKPGGTLIVETPDFEFICYNFPNVDEKQKYWLTRHAYGSQEADWAYHRDGWYESKFRKLLPEIGFKVLRVEHSTSRVYLPNITVTAQKNG